MLQDLLNLGLVDIGTDDSRFAKMEAASEKLSTQIEESSSLLITATLVALDDTLGEDDPFFERVEGLVIEEWNTLRNTHVNRPRELLRSITISALATATEGNPERCAIVWNTAASRLSHDQTSLGKAAALLTQCFSKVFSTAENEALRRAGMLKVEPTKRRSKKSKASAPEAPTLTGSIKSDELLLDVARAVGPQNQQGQAPKDPNPGWPNQGQQWSFQFTPRMTDALVNAVNLGTSRLAKSITAEFVTHIAAMEEHLQKQLGQVESLQSKLAESEIAGRMRLDVLWWSQARYSLSQNAAYSTLPSATAAIAAAADLAEMTPALAPVSVTHVLGETMTACTPNEPISLLNHLKNLKESQPLGLKEFVPTGDANSGRIPLLQIVTEAAEGKNISEDDLRARAGVDPELALEPSELAMWLFREFQAQRIAAGVS